MLGPYPSFEISRPAQNFGPGSTLPLELDILGAPGGLSHTDIDCIEYNKALQPAASLVLASEILRLHILNEIPFNSHARDDLTDYLRAKLPEEMDDTLFVDTMPATTYEHLDNKHWVNIGNSPEIHQERADVKAIIGQYYKGRQLDSDSWLDDEIFAGIWVAKASSVRAQATAEVLCDRLTKKPELLPPVIMYNGINIVTHQGEVA